MPLAISQRKNNIYKSQSYLISLVLEGQKPNNHHKHEFQVVFSGYHCSEGTSKVSRRLSSIDVCLYWPPHLRNSQILSQPWESNTSLIWGT